LKAEGICLYFKDREEPISFGRRGKQYWYAEFNENQRIKTIKLTPNVKDAVEGDYRQY
jgi:hypothetical protein